MKKFKVNLIMTTVAVAILCSNTLPVFAASNNRRGGRIESSERKYNFEEEVTTFSDLGVLADVWEQFVEENPNSTEAEQKDFLIKYVEENGVHTETMARQGIATYGIGDYIPGFSSLNETERKLAAQNPVQAVLVYNCSTKALDATIEYYGTNGYQDNSDAFRHCLWNALMKKSMNATYATIWSTAHEANSSGIDKEMDLFNNSIGCSIFVTNKSDTEIYDAVKAKVSDGTCRRIINNELVATDSSGLIK